MKDAVATMGGLLPPDAGGRDAVHVAVFSAVADVDLEPNADVSRVGMRGDDTVVDPEGQHIGVVDPFLRETVPAGKRFWVYLYPRTITGLSHAWEHPAFEDTGDSSYAHPSRKFEAEIWLRDFAESYDSPSFESLMKAIEYHLDGGGYRDEYLHFSGQDAHGVIPDEFWDHVEAFLGRSIDDGDRAEYFSCSC